MFTGIISACVPIAKIVEKNGIRTVTVALPEQWQLQLGESVSVDGVCSTVVAVTPQDFTVSYMPETLRVTTLKLLQKNAIVNLEKSLKLQDVVSGHLVSGHIDCTGSVSDVTQDADSHVISVIYPEQFAQYLIQKGSVALNGVSLTVIAPTDTQFSVAIIPHTWENTNLRTLAVGGSLNIEFDLIAKYIAKQLPYVRTIHETNT